MSLEKKERRMCDICKRIMSEESFYSCQRNYAYKENEYHATSLMEYYVGDRMSTYNGTYTDVCMKCWEKMKK